MKFVLSCQVDIHESSCEANAEFNFQAFKEPKIQNFGKYGTTSGVCWVYYEPPTLNYSKVGTYDQSRFYDFFYVGKFKNG